MTRDEAKEILLPYRHGTTDAHDPMVEQALAFARNDAALGRWLEEHCARQYVLREKFRKIPVPDGLLQQIISEHAAANRASFLKKHRTLIALAGMAVVLLGVFLYWQQPGEDAKLAVYQKQMALMMSTGYGMDLETNDDSSIREYLKQSGAPSDFVLTEPLKHTVLTGCAIEDWQDKKVSMVCFHTGKDTNLKASDMWLVVVKKKLVRDVPKTDEPQFSQINRLAIATWTKGDKLYVLACMGSAEDIKKYL